MILQAPPPFHTQVSLSSTWGTAQTHPTDPPPCNKRVANNIPHILTKCTYYSILTCALDLGPNGEAYGQFPRRDIFENQRRIKTSEWNLKSISMTSLRMYVCEPYALHYTIWSLQGEFFSTSAANRHWRAHNTWREDMNSPGVRVQVGWAFDRTKNFKEKVCVVLVFAPVFHASGSGSEHTNRGCSSLWWGWPLRTVHKGSIQPWPLSKLDGQ